MGVTVVLITASYRDQEFVRVGYYVNNEYEDPEMRENPPAEPQFDKLVRTIASDQPRVTKFKINWDSVSATNAPGEAASQSTTVPPGTSTTNGGEAPGTSAASQSEANLLAMMNTNTQDSEMVDISNMQKNGGEQAGDIKSGMNANSETNKENINDNLSQMAINDSRA